MTLDQVRQRVGNGPLIVALLCAAAFTLQGCGVLVGAAAGGAAGYAVGREAEEDDHADDHHVHP